MVLWRTRVGRNGTVCVRDLLPASSSDSIVSLDQANHEQSLIDVLPNASHRLTCNSNETVV